MCGILAALSPAPAPFDLRPGLDALAHRGPDDRGLVSSPCRRVHLGHTRLALVDLDHGRQPFSSEDGQVLAVVNGEFYDDERLRKQLLDRGHRLQSRCDSELLIHLYEDHGTAALRFLRGEFAFILWDQRRQMLWAARDRFGIKPLVYTQHQGRLLLASEAKALFALGVTPVWDEASLFQASSLQYLLPGRTLFASVSALPSGCELRADQNGFSIHRYWDMDYPYHASPIESEQEAVDELKRRLDEAVRLRLRGDAPVACQLSGGIDSAAVLASAARQSSTPMEAFTVSFGGAYDEAAKASEIAKFVGARLHLVEASADALAAAFEAAVIAGEGLAINGHIAAKYLLTKAIRGAGYKAALTGEGADEVLAGYAHLRADLAGTTAHLATSNQASAGLMLPVGTSLPLDAVRSVLGFVPTWLQAKGTLGQRLRSLLRDDLLERYADHDPAAELISAFEVSKQLQGRGRVEQSLYLWTKLALEGYILRTLGDAQEMAHSIEGRLPFLDHELFAWLRAVPTHLKIRDGVEKYILREAQRKRLPESVVRREKHPFLAPPLAGPMLELTQDRLRSSALRASSLFDATKVVSLLDALPTLSPEERKHSDPALYLLLSSVVLGEHYRIEAREPLPPRPPHLRG